MAPEPALSQPRKMLLLRSTCSFCSAPLPKFGVNCAQCLTRYCDNICKRQHWRAGHGKLCEKIFLNGGAEGHHATRRCAIADAMAVRSCVADTAGEICYICRTDGTKEGLVRGCACRGSMGAAHLSCLAQQAVLANEDDPSHTGAVEDLDLRMGRWQTCRLCWQRYHGVVACALGWRCWHTYAPLPRGDARQFRAMGILASALIEGKRSKEALSLLQTSLADARLYFASDASQILNAQEMVSKCYNKLGQHKKALHMQREVFEGRLALERTGINTMRAAACLAYTLVALGYYREAKGFAFEQHREAKEVPKCEQSCIELQLSFAIATWKDPGASQDDAWNAGKILDMTYRHSRLVLGMLHPATQKVREAYREFIAADVSCAYFMCASRVFLDDIKNLRLS